MVILFQLYKAHVFLQCLGVQVHNLQYELLSYGRVYGCSAHCQALYLSIPQLPWETFTSFSLSRMELGSTTAPNKAIMERHFDILKCVLTDQVVLLKKTWETYEFFMAKLHTAGLTAKDKHTYRKTTGKMGKHPPFNAHTLYYPHYHCSRAHL